MIVPMLCVGMQLRTVCVPFGYASLSEGMTRSVDGDVTTRSVGTIYCAADYDRSHALRGNAASDALRPVRIASLSEGMTRSVDGDVTTRSVGTI